MSGCWFEQFNLEPQRIGHNYSFPPVISLSPPSPPPVLAGVFSSGYYIIIDDQGSGLGVGVGVRPLPPIPTFALRPPSLPPSPLPNDPPRTLFKPQNGCLQ